MSEAPATAEASFPGANGRIAFTSDPTDSDLEVYAMNADGTGQVDLTNNPNSDSTPAWSPDGQKILFSTDRDVNDEIYVMNADGTSPADLTNNAASDTSPAWSPNGTKIAFTRDDGSFNLEIWSMNANGTTQANLTNNSALDTGAAWSPDGTKIAFTTTRDGNSEIYVMNADGTAQANLTNNAATDSGADWSPDGQKIAFASRRDGNAEIYVMNADGTNPTRLTTNNTSDFSPAWSPDGQKIAFRSNRDGNGYEIYVMNADGTAQTRLTNNAWLDTDPDWQPLPAPPPPPYDVPRIADPLAVSLVPSFRQTISASQCQARGGAPSSHGAPLALGSCNPPAFTPGAAARFGPNTVGSATYAVIHGDTNPGNGDQADVSISAGLTDVRTGAGADYDPSPGGSDITLATKVRLSDTYNGGSLSEPATVTDFELNSAWQCIPTADPSLGSSCNLNTTADAVTPGTIKEGKNAVMQVFRVRVNDSGSNGVRGDGDDKLFAQQGYYVP